jgi:hypothetical protein
MAIFFNEQQGGAKWGWGTRDEKKINKELG